MTIDVPQEILDRLTRVEMPAMPHGDEPVETLVVDGRELPVHRSQVLVLGSGAAGLRAAVEAKRRGLDVLIATMSPYGGTSACSGSDKQTLHTAGTAKHGDDFLKLAADLSSGGCMDRDSAYIEAVGSIGALAGLQYMGLPLPQDRFGAVLRYQTDHDEVGRATSCGPRTSRLMVKVLAEEAIRLGVRFLAKSEGVRLLSAEGCCRGVLLIDHAQRDQHFGFALALADDVVLATGGPGELYRDSVYPRHCYGSLGMAIEAGIAVCNLSESQFGIGTRRDDFPWNLSGTYAQVMPFIYSLDENGTEHNFLADWYRSTRELVSNVFRKGYQWPFHAQRTLDFGSSLVDVAVAEQGALGRRVYMDFLRNPAPGADGRAFSLDELDDDVHAYLANNDALLARPIERLKRMNPLAIELYRMHGTDLEHEPLPFAVNNQHMNGGVSIDAWFRSSLPGCYAIGEVAGSHGVTRPGGAALNAGQVGAQRCAEHMARRRTLSGAVAPVAAAAVARQVGEALRVAERACESGLPVAAVREEIQTRMSERAGFLCPVDELPAALAEATALRRRIAADGLACGSARRVADAFRWWHLALTSEAVLLSLERYTAAGGGSRGARAYLDPAGDDTPLARHGAVDRLRFRRERPADRDDKLQVHFDGQAMHLEHLPLRDLEDPAGIFFERHWPDHLTDHLATDDYRHQ